MQQPPAKQLTIADVTTKSEKQENKSRPWVNRFGIRLTMRQKSILLSCRTWLDDELINAAQYMLREQHPPISGFQSPLLGDCLAMTPPKGEFVQILLVCNNHWLVVSTVGCKPSTVKVFDSLGGRLPKTSLKLVADLMQTKEKAITFEFVGVQKQDGASDCGLFAIAFTTSICNGHDPTTLRYNQSAMRSHLLKCIEQGQITPFPSVPRRKPSKTIENVVVPVYCICRLIDNGTKMIQCAGCNEWFHVACVQVEKKFITCQKLDWFCPNCTRN